MHALASRGAQIILLTRHAPTDAFLVDYIDDVRTATNNDLIYAEQVDLSSLHSIRLFATKWIDNAPPRRLDMIILCANVMTPYWGKTNITPDGIEEEWAINYLANFHLLSILAPGIRAQPPDRDVRILFSACSSYIGGTLELKDTEAPSKSGETSYARSKLAVMTFASAFQKHLDAYARPDKQPNNARAFIVDPGYSRTPGTRRWLSGGSLIGLAVYLVMWPLWWLVLKSSDQGAQSFLKSAMEAEYTAAPGGKMIKECMEIQPLRQEVQNEEVARQLWEFSEKQIEALEKAGALKRGLAKKEMEREENKTKKETTQKETKKDTTNGSAKQEGIATGSENTTTSTTTPGSRRSRKKA